jgi:PTS system, lactose/cellobiose family IIC component
MKKINKFIEKLGSILEPLGQKFGQQKHLNAITSGIMLTIPLTIIGAIINILAHPPVTEEMIKAGGFAGLFKGWFYFASKNYDTIMMPYNMSMGIFTIAAVLGISYSLAKSYKMKALSTSLIAIVLYFTVAAPSGLAVSMSKLTKDVDVSKLTGTNMIPTDYLGVQGLFAGIIIALVSVEITRFCVQKNLMFRLPESVPPMISESISSIIPALFNLIIIFGINLLLINFAGCNLPELIVKIITPITSMVNSPIAIIMVVSFSTVLWWIGIHPGVITNVVLFPLFIDGCLKNADLVNAGSSPHMIAAGIGFWGLIGGAGASMGLTLLCSKSKSEQLKTMGRISLVPGFCGINEPMVFGVPIAYNPILFIPFVFAPMICMFLAWGAYSIGFLSPEYNLILVSLPMGVGEFASTLCWRNAVFPYIIALVEIVLWYPFFKIQERKCLHEEAGLETAESN